MTRRNHPRHPRIRRPMLADRYDLDYVNLPEYPQYIRIVVKPYKTIFVNLDADFYADDFHVVKDMHDPVMRKIASRIGDALA